MKSISDDQKPLVWYLQGGILINTNQTQKQSENIDGTMHTYHEYDQFKVSEQPTREEIIGVITGEGFELSFAETIADKVLSLI